MAEAHKRKKQPEQVRHAIVEAAISIAINTGFDAVTTQAVADAAGVTKGGLFHHFPSRQALIEGMFSTLLQELDAAIDQDIAEDEVAHGCFSRAYVTTFVSGRITQAQSRWNALPFAILMEPSLTRLWGDWLRQRLERHNDTDTGPLLEIIRMAADGYWLFDVTINPSPPEKAHAIRQHLLGMTYEAKAP